MKKYGLIGNPLGHSFSPQIHALIGGYGYGLYQMEAKEVPEFMRNFPLDGINVTIPYKETVIPFCAHLSEEAKNIGSVNTIVKEKDGTLSGYNTDASGFLQLLIRLDLTPKPKKALILGSGGSSKTAKYVLGKYGTKEIITVSRNGKNNYENLYLHKDAELIVNTTPVGMFPGNGKSPVDLADFPDCRGVIDLIYNPEKTALIFQAKEAGIPYVGGLYMLVCQAVKAAEIFGERACSESETEDIYNKIDLGMRNIVFVGMPSSGKTTVGRELSKMLGREFIDCDEVFSERYETAPGKYIERCGEADFREKESVILAEVTKLSGKVIATGGGAVTVPENLSYLSQNGKCVFIERDISLLSEENRPLSKGRIEKLYEERLPLYEKVCDVRIKNVGGPEETAKEAAIKLGIV